MNISLNTINTHKTNFKASLLTQMMQQQHSAMPATQALNTSQTPAQVPAYVPVTTPIADKYNTKYAAGSLLNVLMNKPKYANAAQSVVASAPVAAVAQTEAPLNYKNNLRSMFQNNQAVIFALIPRTFTAKDTDGNGLIQGNERPGYFSTMVERLDELKTYGINTLHLLPINPPGLKAAKGSAGSVYAPLDYLAIDPKLDDPTNPKNVYEEAKDAIKECHKRDIKVMVDLPSCMSVDLYEARPDLRATDAAGNPKTPEGWEDIRMFSPWQDEDNKVLNKALYDYHKKFVDMCIDLGIDGIRADVGRAKPPEFWDHLTSYARSKDPEFAFLAECYTNEDASPMKNMPADRPFDALKAGFDSYYGQYHIFHMWKAKDFQDFMKESLNISKDPQTGERILPKGKSLIGSFATHDDDSPMSHGGPDYCMMTNVVQTTVPMTNPYIISGYESGDRYLYDYDKKYIDKTFAQMLSNPLYKESVDYMMKSLDYAPVISNLEKTADKNRSLAELENDSRYSATIKFLLEAYNKNHEPIDKNISLSAAVKNNSFNTILTNVLDTARDYKNIKELMNSDAKNQKIEALADKNSGFKNIIEYFENNMLTKDNIKYYVHTQRIDIFNESRQPKGNHPEIGHHFGYLMNCVRPKYGELITKGSYIPLKVDNNKIDEVIAYARCKDGKTLITIANHDVNSRQHVKVEIPGLSASQQLDDLSPKYGSGSEWKAENNAIDIDLGPAQAHIFEVNTPNLEQDIKAQGGEVLQQYL